MELWTGPRPVEPLTSRVSSCKRSTRITTTNGKCSQNAAKCSFIDSCTNNFTAYKSDKTALRVMMFTAYGRGRKECETNGTEKCIQKIPQT